MTAVVMVASASALLYVGLLWLIARLEDGER